MLVFREGVWRDVQVPTADPLLSERHRMQMAAYMTQVEKRRTISDAEAMIYQRLYRGLSLSGTTLPPRER
jgi:hypothetical protein